MGEQVGYRILKGTVEGNAGQDGIIRQVIMNLFSGAFRIPDVGDGKDTDAVRAEIIRNAKKAEEEQFVDSTCRGIQKRSPSKINEEIAPVNDHLYKSEKKDMFVRLTEIIKKYDKNPEDTEEIPDSDDKENMLFSGNTGLGKTFLSGCIARTVADRGFSVAYETASRLFTKMERARFERDEQCRLETEGALAADLLILDDLGTEMTGQFTSVALYGLINDRLLAGKPTIISTNLTMEELRRRYSVQVGSRLDGEYHVLRFYGEDIRLLRKQRL